MTCGYAGGTRDDVQSLQHKRLDTPLLRGWPPRKKQHVQAPGHRINENVVSHLRRQVAQHSRWRNRIALCLQYRSMLVNLEVQLLIPNCARQERVGRKPAQEDGNCRKEQRPRLTCERFPLCATCLNGEAAERLAAVHAQARDHQAVVWEQRLRLRRRCCCQVRGTGVTTQHASYHFLIHQLVEDDKLVSRGRRTSCHAAPHRRRRHPGARQDE